MAQAHHIRNPFELAIEQFRLSGDQAAAYLSEPHVRPATGPIVIRRIAVADLWAALREGMQDFSAARDDVLFIALVYPFAGLLLSQAILRQDMAPLIFPLASGFALLGPLAAIGLYEISRRRERGAAVSWVDALGVFKSPALGSIFALGLVLVAIFLLWLAAAYGIYLLTFGNTQPASLGAFAAEVLTTPNGWAMIALGVGVGAVFAAVVLTIAVISFPLMLDRNVGMAEAVSVSVRAVRANARVMALWGLIVAGALVLGSLPALAGLIVVMPVLGHATWRLYRRIIG